MFTWADVWAILGMFGIMAGSYWYMERKIREAKMEEEAKEEIHALEKKIDEDVEKMPLKSLVGRISLLYSSRRKRGNGTESGDSE